MYKSQTYSTKFQTICLKISCELHNSDLRIELLKKRLLGSWHHRIKMRLKTLKLLSQKYPLKAKKMQHLACLCTTFTLQLMYLPIMTCNLGIFSPKNRNNISASTLNSVNFKIWPQTRKCMNKDANAWIPTIHVSLFYTGYTAKLWSK